MGFLGSVILDSSTIIAARGLQKEVRAHLMLRATQGRKCFPWQMHVKLPLEHITTTISMTPSLISELIRVLTNGHEGQPHN